MNKALPTAPGYLRALDSNGIEGELAAVTISTFAGSDGAPRHVYRYGSLAAPTLVLLPPTGMSWLLVCRLARALSTEFHVVSWESRGCPDTDMPLADADTDLDRQADEFAEMLAGQGLSEFHFVGWCQAAQTVVLACQSAGALKPLSISLIAPAGLGYSVLASEFERYGLPVYLHIASQDVTYSGKMRAILDTCASHLNPNQLAQRLSLLHLSSAEATFRFARYMKAFDDSKRRIKPLVGDVLDRVPTQLIHCKDDPFSHYSESVQLARRHPAARLEILSGGGHLFVFEQAESVAAMVRRFVVEVNTSSMRAWYGDQ